MAAPGTDPIAKAVDKIKAQQAAAVAMEKARAQLGLMTKEQERAQKAADRLAASQERVAKAQKKKDDAAAAKATSKAAAREKREADDAVKAQERADKAMAKSRKQAQDKAAKEAEKSLAKMAKDQDKNNAKIVKEQQKAEKAAKKLKEANESIDFEAVTAPLELLSKAARAAGPEAEAAAFAATMWAAALTALGGAIVKTIGFVTELVSNMTVLKAQFMALGKGGAGGATLASIDAIASKLPFAVDQVREWGKSLMMAKLQGKDLEKAIQAVAGAAALMGDSGAAAAQRLIETLARGGFEAAALVAKIKSGSNEAQSMLNDMGLRLSDVAAALGTTVKGMQRMRLSARQMAEAVEKALAIKAAGPLGAMMLTWPSLVAKVKEGFLSLFAKLGPNVKTFMQAVQRLFGHFGKGTPAMRALGRVATEAFGTILKYATKAVNAISKWVKQNLTAKNISSTWDKIKSAIGKVVPVVEKLWSIFVKVWPIIKLVAAVALAFGGAILAMAATVASAMGAVAAVFWGAIGSIVEAISSLDLSAFVTKMIDAAKAGIQGFKQALGIASPSKVMMQMGEHTATGAAEGIDQGTSKVEASAANMGASAAGAAAGAMGGAGKGGKGAISITVEAGAVVIHAGGATVTDEGLATAFERLLMAQGLGAR